MALLPLGRRRQERGQELTHTCSGQPLYQDQTVGWSDSERMQLYLAERWLEKMPFEEAVWCLCPAAARVFCAAPASVQLQTSLT